MIWFTWRQFRTPAVVAAGALAVLAVVLLVNGNAITDLYASVAACQSDCGNTVERLPDPVPQQRRRHDLLRRPWPSCTRHRR